MTRPFKRIFLALRITAVVALATSTALAGSGEQPLTASTSDDASAVVWNTVETQVDVTTHVRSIQVDNKNFEVVSLPTGESFEISAELLDLPDAKAFSNSLSLSEIETAREQSRVMLEATLRALQSDAFNGEMSIDELGHAFAMQPAIGGEAVKTVNLFKRMFAFNHELYEPMPKGLKFGARLKRFALMSWQFIFVETLHASIDYGAEIWRAKRQFKEYGISVDLKVEPQIFIANFNPTQKVKALRRSYALSLEVAFNPSLRRVYLRTRLRREKGSGGLGLPAVKVEFKIFQSDGTSGAHSGVSWYPVSPPIVSFVLDKSKHYYAQGITFGFNTGDLIPGSTLTNTFAKFEQVQDPDLNLHLIELPQRATNAFDRAVKRVLPQRLSPGPRTCSDIFG